MVLNLTLQEISTLNNLISGVSASPLVDPESFISQICDIIPHVPERIVHALHCFKQHGSSTGFLLISGIPIDDCSIPHTPSSNAFHIGSCTNLAKIQALFNQIIGEMVAYEAEGYGKLFQDMVPSSTLTQTQTSLGSDVELEIHTEQAFSDLRPDALSLACLRGDTRAKTYTLHVSQILTHLTPRELYLIRQSLWNIGVDASFKMSGHTLVERETRGPMPILSGDEEDPTLVFDQDLMRGVSDEAEALRKKIIDIYYEHRHEHVLSPGEIVLIDNRRAVHGRSSFRPKFDGSDRFIVRSFIVHDYKKSEHSRSGRIVLARYS